MSEKNESFVYQLSVMVGPNRNMVNIRGDDDEVFAERVRWATSNAPEIMACIEAFSPHAPPASVGVLTAPGAMGSGGIHGNAVATPPVARTAASGEIGPVTLTGCAEKSGIGQESGKPYTQYIFEFGGKKMSSMDALMGEIGKGLVGKQVFIATATKGKYTNLVGIRPA